ncbi:hypothetical protein JL721_1063 [Aureococcus anophagefferens]|nr:hypothetical protein JL721_1063 [Aureococcus anophagefferens]
MKVAIVVTAANEAQAESCQKELDGRKDLADFLCLAVADPAGCRIGSGGGTLNALVAAHDAIAGPQSQTCDWLDEHLVCVVHSGGDSQRSPSQSVCGKAWSTLPLFGGRSGGELAAPFDLLVDQLLALCAGCRAAASSRLAVNADGARYGPKHGVYVAGGGDAAAVGGAACANFLQKAPIGALEAAGAVDGRGEVALDSGVLYVDAPTSKALLKLCTDDGGALRSATSRGAAGGCARVELYSDVLNAVSGGGYDDFPTYAAMKADEADPAKVRRFREALWAALRPVELRVHRPPGARFAHLGTTAEYMDLLTLPSLFREPFGLRRFARNAAPPGCLVDDGADAWSVALNSVISKPSTLAAKAVVEHSRVDSLDGLGAGSLLSCCRGLPADFSLDAKTMLQQASSGDADARALWKRAPRLSMREVLARGDKVAELDWKLRLRREVSDRAGPFPAALSAARPADDATGLRVVDGRVSEPVESLEHLEVASGAWDVLAVTADTRRQADYYVRQLRCRPGLKCREIVGVCTSIDAAGSRLGSGGATLHALLTVAEPVRGARRRDVLADRLREKVLILHSGASGLNGGALWLPVPLDAGGGPAASVDVVLSAVNGAAATSGPGVWVCSGELLLSSATRAALASLDWTAGGRRGAVTALAVPGSGAVAAKHGCFTRIDPEATSGAAAAVRGFEYMPRGAPAGTLVACGIFRFETEAALAFLDAHAVPPFSSCTAPGVDDGLAPAPFSLFLDVIPALLGAAAPPAALALRGVLRKRCALYAVAAGPEKGDAPLFLKRPRDCLDFGSSMGSYVKEEEGSFTRKAVVLNSVLGGDGAVAERAVLVNCRFAAGSDSRGPWARAASPSVSGTPTCWRRCPRASARTACRCCGAARVVAHGVDDGVEGTRFRGADLETDVLPRLRNVAAEDLWRPGDVRCLATARLFAVGAPPPGWLLAAAAGEPAAAPDGWLRSDRVSLREAYDDCDVVSDGAWAAELEVRSRCDFVKRALEGRSPVGDGALRVDLAGGWTDTPPVAFEHGRRHERRRAPRRPAAHRRATRLDAPVLRFRVETADGSVLETEAAALADLDDRSNPQAPAALLKCALVVCGVVDPRGAPLDVQLAAGGLEVASWSRVPTGSGLGTSSILAACLVAAIGGAADAAYDVDARRRDIVHDVMRVEQELTTGGGWQDNVGGVYGGAKIAVSPPRLPLTVDTTAVPMAPGLLDAHLVLAYTGRARLAKNLLQSVLRKWHARLPGITTTTDALVAGARRAAAALEAGDLARLGAALDAYWAQKKTMADGAEPAFIRDMIAALRPRVHGAALCGAGGGGFLCLITKQPNDVDAIRRVLEAHADLGDVSLHVATVDREGLALARS